MSEVRSLDRAMLILKCFIGAPAKLGVSELAKRTGLSVATAHRIVTAMCSNQLLIQNSDRSYSLGPFLLEVSGYVTVADTVEDVAEPVMISLRDRFNETVGLHRFHPPARRSVVAQLESTRALRRRYTDLHSPMSLLIGAPGQAILAELDDATIESVAGAAFTPAGTRYPITRDAVRKRVAETRTNGWAVTHSDRVSGISSVAVSLRDQVGSLIGALSYSVPTVRWSPESPKALGECLLEAKTQLEQVIYPRMPFRA